MWPLGPQATTSLRNDVVDAGSVTPTSSVVWSCRASRLRSAACGEPASGRSSATTSSGHSTRSGDGCGGGHGERRRQLGGEDGARRDLLLAQTALPTTLHQRHPHGPSRRTAVGRHQADHGHDDDPRRDDEGADESRRPGSVPGLLGLPGQPGPAPADRTPEGRARRGHDHAAGPHAGRDEEGAAEPGQLDQRSPGLTEEHAAERQPAEGPRHAHGFGQRAGAHEGECASALRRGRHGGGGEEERFDEDEDDGAVPVEGAGPEEPDGVAAQPGQPARPDPGPPRQPGQAPVEQRGPDQTQRPPAPRGKREGQEDACRERGDGDAAPARQAAHKSESVAAALRPLAMQAGMPTPR